MKICKNLRKIMLKYVNFTHKKTNVDDDIIDVDIEHRVVSNRYLPRKKCLKYFIDYANDCHDEFKTIINYIILSIH